ncbi:MAG TPA: thioredoxin fold domain-containing protein [Cytophagaceae bacterium]|nr:thioredoxin fold domain-containing protein [Cytophagaceae bacterium]
MKTKFFIITVLVMLSVAGVIVSFTWEKSDKPTDEIKWMSYAEATKLSQKKKKKIFIDVYTDWCGWCKKMDATTMKDPKIIEYMNKKFYAVKLNAESNKTSAYKGTAVSEKELATRIFKANGYPTTLYLSDGEDLIFNIPGYREAGELDKILHFVGEEKYKTQSWEQFNASYVAE